MEPWFGSSFPSTVCECRVVQFSGSQKGQRNDLSLQIASEAFEKMYLRTLLELGKSPLSVFCKNITQNNFEIVILHLSFKKGSVNSAPKQEPPALCHAVGLVHVPHAYSISFDRVHLGGEDRMGVERNIN